MSAKRTLRRTAATLAVAAAAVLATLASARAAYAEDTVRVTVSGLNSTQTAGHPDGFSVRFENRSRQPIFNLHSAIVVHLDGVQPGQVHIYRNGGELPSSSNGGDLVFTDPEAWLGLARAQRSYQILFQPEAPTGHGELAAIALDGNGNQLGSDGTSFGLRAGDGRATPTPSHSASPAATVNVPLPTGPGVSIAPLGDGGRTAPLAGETGGVPVYLYVMGGVLVAIGAVILWLLFRAPRPPADDGAYVDTGPAGTPSLGYPPRLRTTAPTAVLPAIRDSRAATMQEPRHGVNPAHQLNPAQGPPQTHGLDRGGTTAQGPRAPSTDVRSVPPGVDPWA
jgi:hypothetical protein